MTQAPKPPATPKVPDASTESVVEIVEMLDTTKILVVLLFGIALGVGVYYVLTHVMIEDADNA